MNTADFWPGCLAPSFTAPVVFPESTSVLDLQSLHGKYVLLLFYPVDFGYISPTELMSVENNLQKFQEDDCEVFAISTSSILSKVAFLSLNAELGGAAGINFGLVEDKDGTIASKYGVVNESNGYSCRAMVLINRKGRIVLRSMSDLPIGSGIMEALRILKVLNENEEMILSEAKIVSPFVGYGITRERIVDLASSSASSDLSASKMEDAITTNSKNYHSKYSSIGKDGEIDMNRSVISNSEGNIDDSNSDTVDSEDDSEDSSDDSVDSREDLSGPSEDSTDAEATDNRSTKKKRKFPILGRSDTTKIRKWLLKRPERRRVRKVMREEKKRIEGKRLKKMLKEEKKRNEKKI